MKRALLFSFSFVLFGQLSAVDMTLPQMLVPGFVVREPPAFTL
jgi:hypothetical protein